jgi:GMP synthase (glutamine-hydrolysing)
VSLERLGRLAPVRILSLIHGRDAHSGVFGDVARAAGHDLDERSFPLGNPPSPSTAGYDALMVFGGAMNVHEVEDNPWIHDEIALIGDALERDVPILGVCLGGQLLAAAAGGRVTRAPEPEIGWYEVEKTPAALDDPVLADLPARFLAYQWHSYQAEPPETGVVLATSPVCAQAFRVGDRAWGTQFHAEVTTEIVESWIRRYGSDPDAVAQGFDSDAQRRRLREEIGRWNALGRTLVGAFLTFAARRTGVEREPARV